MGENGVVEELRATPPTRLRVDLSGS